MRGCLRQNGRQSLEHYRKQTVQEGDSIKGFTVHDLWCMNLHCTKSYTVLKTFNLGNKYLNIYSLKFFYSKILTRIIPTDVPV